MTTRRLQIQIDQTGNAQTGLQNIVGKFGGIGGVAKVAAGGLALLGGATVAAGGYLINLGSDAEEMESKFNVVFGASAQQARNTLDEFGNAVGRNTFELMDMSSGLQDIMVSMGFTREEAAEVSTSMAKLSVDVGSFKNVADSEVMSRFTSGLIGNHDALDALGVAITESTLKQQLLKMGIEGGVQAATEQEKVQARLAIIMNATKDAQGDAARTAGSWANQTRALKAELGEAATTMAGQLMPIVTPMLESFTTWIREIMPAAVTIFQEWAGRLQSTVGPAMIMINDALTRIAKAFGINTDKMTAGKVVLALFKAGLDAAVIALQLTAIMLQGAAVQMENLRRVWDGVANFVRSGIDGWNRAFSGISGAISRVVSSFHSMASAARRAVSSIPSWLRPGSPSQFEIAMLGVAGAVDQVSESLDRMGGKRVDFRPPAAEGLTPPVTSITPSLPPMFTPAPVNNPLWGTPININVTYQPIVTTETQMHVQTILGPMIRAEVRKLVAEYVRS